MRVLILASHFPRPTNRTMGVWALKQALALTRAGHDVRVISMCDWVPQSVAWLSGHPKLISRAACPRREIWDGVVVDYPRWPRYHAGPHAGLAYAHPGAEMQFALRFARRPVLRIAAGFDPEVIYAHGTVVNGSLGAYLSAALQTPLVCHDHDYGEIRDCQTLPARREHFQRVAAASDALVVVSSSMAALVQRVVPDADPIVLPNGAEVVSRDGIEPQHSPVVFCAATFTSRKQIPLLIDAFAQVARRHAEVRLRVAGDGPERAEIEARITRHRLGDRIDLLGFIEPDDVLAEMQMADLFALLSHDEPFAVVYLEAMAAGLPVICTDDGGITDVLQDGVHGRVIRDGDVDGAASAILILLSDPEQRRRLGDAARELVTTELTWDANAERLGRLFEGFSQRRRPRDHGPNVAGVSGASGPSE